LLLILFLLQPQMVCGRTVRYGYQNIGQHFLLTFEISNT